MILGSDFHSLNPKVLEASVKADLVLKPGLTHEVMVAKGGDALLASGAQRALIEDLIPCATVVTPNHHEAEVLTGLTIKGLEEMKAAAKQRLKRAQRPRSKSRPLEVPRRTPLPALLRHCGARGSGSADRGARAPFLWRQCQDRARWLSR